MWALHLFPQELEKLTKDIILEMANRLYDRGIKAFIADREGRSLLYGLFSEELLDKSGVNPNLVEDFVRGYDVEGPSLLLKMNEEKIIQIEESQLEESSRFKGLYITRKILIDYLNFLVGKLAFPQALKLAKLADYIISLELVKRLEQFNRDIRIHPSNQFGQNWVVLEAFLPKFGKIVEKFYTDLLQKFSECLGKLEDIVNKNRNKSRRIRDVSFENDFSVYVVPVKELGEMSKTILREVKEIRNNKDFLNNYGLGYFEEVSTDYREKEVYLNLRADHKTLKNCFLIHEFFQDFSKIFQMYQYFELRKVFREDGDYLWGAHNIEINGKELDILFFNERKSRVKVFECTLSCDDQDIQAKENSLKEKIESLKREGIEFEEAKVVTPKGITKR